MTAMRVTHVLGNGEQAVEIAPGYFKLAGHPIHGQLRIDATFGGARPIESTDTIEVDDRDIVRKDRLVRGALDHARALAELS